MIEPQDRVVLAPPVGRAQPWLKAFLLRVVQRPWPWLLRYLLTALPAMATSVLLAFPLGPWFRLPLFLEALDRRSLDDLLEVLLHQPEGPSIGFSFVGAMVLIPLIWLAVHLIGLWLEGGVLATYALLKAPTWRTFAEASSRWFGRFLLLALIGIALSVILTGGIAGAALLAGRVNRPLGIAAGIAGAAVVILAGAWVRLARAAMVVHEDGRVLHALGEAWRTIAHRPLVFLALVAGVLALRVLLTWLGGALGAVVPMRAWLLSLVIQQPVQMALVGAGLARRAAEVGLVTGTRPAQRALDHV